MAYQMGVTTSNKRRIREIDALNARQTMLPQLLANKQRADALAREDELNTQRVDQWNAEQDLASKQFKYQRRYDKKSREQQQRGAEAQMGLEAGKLGMTVANRYGDSGSYNTLFNKSGLNTTGNSNMFGGATLGTTAGGALAGYGASKLAGGKNKTKKALLGVGAGALLGGLSGGWGGAVSGGLGGGFGSLF